MAVFLLVGDVAHHPPLLEILREQGHQVVSAPTAVAGFNRATQAAPEVVIVTRTMPGVDGFELLQLLRQSVYQGPTLLFTEPITEKIVKDAWHLGAVGIIQSTDEVAVLHETLKRVLGFAASQRGHFDWPQSLSVSKLLAEQSKPYRNLKGQIKELSRELIPVLLVGERGVGKTLLARALHELTGEKIVPVQAGKAKKGLFGGSGSSLVRPFIICPHCLAATGQIEEIFGVPDGPPGYMQLAEGGTLFIEEFASLVPEVQERLCRELESTRRGAAAPRIIAATTRNLAGDVSFGRFHRQLYYLFAANSVHPYPLRRHPETIVPLSQVMMNLLLPEASTVPRLPHEVTNVLKGYHWPGNIRQLQEVIAFMLAKRDEQVVTISHLPKFLPAAVIDRTNDTDVMTAAEQKQREIDLALQDVDGDVVRAGGLLGIDGRSLTPGPKLKVKS